MGISSLEWNHAMIEDFQGVASLPLYFQDGGDDGEWSLHDSLEGLVISLCRC